MKSYADIIAAVLIFSAALCASFKALYAIRQEESAISSSLFSIAAGQVYYSLTSHGRCAGTLETSLNHQRSVDLDAVLNLNMRSGKRQIPLKGALTAHFNPLLQLQTAELRLVSDGAGITVKASQVNPIRIEISARNGSRTWQKSFSIPGPATLKKSRETSTPAFSLAYQRRLNTASSRLVEIIRPVSETLALRAEQTTRCQDAAETLDLAPLLAKISESPLLREILNNQEANPDD